MKEETLHINFAEMSDDELFEFRDWLQTEKTIIDDEWADELKSITGSTFDPYTRKGERLLKKLGKKYADKSVGVVYLQELVADEFAKRKKFKEEQRYLGKGEVKDESVDEFLEKEGIITDTYRSRIGD